MHWCPIPEAFPAKSAGTSRQVPIVIVMYERGKGEGWMHRTTEDSANSLSYGFPFTLFASRSLPLSSIALRLLQVLP